MKEGIYGFHSDDGKYKWLSNFEPLETPFVFEGIEYLTSEHFYQAMKSLDVEVNKAVAAHPSKGLKKFSRTIELRRDWNTVKLWAMRYILLYKFSDANPNLLAKLLATGNLYIEETNWWSDTYWGVCSKTGKGSNHLGKILMEIRQMRVNERLLEF